MVTLKTQHNLLNELYLREHQQKNGLTLQMECVERDCPLSRTNNSSYRSKFTEKVSQKIVTCLETNTEPVQYVTFSSGDLFMDLIIMAEVLTRKPNAVLVIHFIDPLYQSYKALKNAINTTPLHMVDFNQIEEEIEITTTTDESAQLYSNACLRHKAFQEFVLYLKNNFPESTVVPYVHSSAAQYLKLVYSEKIPPADITAAADLEGELPLYEYALLSERTLIKNPNSNHTLLQLINSKPIHTLHLAPAPQIPLKIFKNGKGKELQLSFFSE